MFFLHEEVIDVFHEKYYIPTIENCHFTLIMSGFLVQWNVVRLETIVYMIIYINKYKLNILQNISKCLIHGLIPFKYKNTCDLCDNIPDKYKKGRLMVNKVLFIVRKLYMSFMKKLHSHNRKMSFHIDHVRILCSIYI